MTTTPEDPFTPPTSQPAATPPPPPPAPGMMAGSAPVPGSTPAGPPLGGAPQGWAPTKPTGLALWTIILTGLVAVAGIPDALRMPAFVDDAQAAYDAGEAPPQTITLTGIIGAVAMLASFIVLALWMSKIRSNTVARGGKVSGPPAVEWWGWFVPLAQYVLPFLGMKGIARGKVSTGLLLGWWLSFCGYWAVVWMNTAVSFSAIDWSTGNVSNPDAYEALIPLAYAGTALLLVSWAFLVPVVRSITARHLED